jgi:hypothetical protein
MEAVRESLAAALEAEDRRYNAARDALDAEHEQIRGHIVAALDSLDGEPAAVIPVGSNGHSDSAAVLDVLEGGDDEADDEAPPAPPVEPTDEVVELGTMTMEDACLTIMASRPGEVWRAEDLQRLLEAGGWSNPKMSSIRACLSLAFRNSKLSRRGPGEYILPAETAKAS